MYLLAELRQKLKDALAERSTHEVRRDAILAAVEARGAKDLNDAETAEFTELRSKIAAIDESKVPLEARIAELVADQESRTAAETLAKSIPTETVTAVRGGVKVGAEEHTYRPGGAHSFLADLYAADQRSGDWRTAQERLTRNDREMAVEYRSTVVSNMAGAVPPKYLLDQYTPIARAGRPFLNSLNSQQLPPDGVSFFIPKGATGTAVGVITEGSGFPDTDVVVGNDNPTVQLLGAKTDVSRTLFERGSYVVDSVIFPDLYAAMDVQEDNMGLNGTSASTSWLGALRVTGINAVAFTSGAPTVALMWPKLADAIQRINAGRFMPATAIYMHPRRWGWMTASIDTTNRPVFNFDTNVADASTFGLGSSLQYGQVVGTVMGLPVITDANIPTTYVGGVPGAGTEDVILIARTPDFILWEDSILKFTFEQAPTTAPGQIRLAIGRFGLFHAGRYPLGISTVSGTGMTPPTF